MGQVEMKFYESHFVKKDRIVFRLFPASMEAYYELLNSPLRIVRSDLDGNNRVIIKDTLRPRWQGDTTNWMKFIRRDHNTAGFVLQTIYKNDPDTKLPPAKKLAQQKLLFDMMLLTCNFDALTAEMCGLLFVDSTIRDKTKYIYKVEYYKIPHTFGEILKVVIDPSVLSVDPKISGLSVKNKNKVSSLKWNFVELRDTYTGYNVQRSDDSVHFVTISKAPVILITTQFDRNKQFVYYNDTMPAVGRKYYYRVKGINSFGVESDGSNIVQAYSTEPVHSNVLIDSIVVIKNRDVRVKWRMENDKETKSIKTYILYHAQKDNGPYRKIYASSDIRHYTDKTPAATNFYKVAAVTFQNDTLMSYSRHAVIIDTIPPGAPENLTAKVDKKGIVTLTWNSNKEPDIQGYKIYKANSLKEEFVQVNNIFIKDTFTVQKLTLNTLSKHIYYCIAASDRNFNSSAKSWPIEVLRPDTLPPAAPRLSSVKGSMTGVEINFIQSNSDDVFKHLIERRNGKQEYQTIQSFVKDDTLTRFIDTTAELAAQYYYRVKAFDEAGNFSSSNEISVTYETGFRKKLREINYTVDRTEKHILLQWKYQHGDIEKFIIYRGRSNEPLTIIKTVDGQTLTYIDKTPNMGNIYEYRIKAVFTNGAESIISDAVKITY